MTLIIDTYNVLGVMGVLPPDLAGLDEDALARLIASSRFAGRKAALICDGVRSRELAGRDGARGMRRRVAGVEIVYAGGGKDADSLIERVIAADSAPRRLLVVSSDRRVQKAASRRRAGVMSSEAFLARLAADAAAPPTTIDRNRLREQIPLDAVSVSAWVREFGASARSATDLVRLAGRAATAAAPSPPPPAEPARAVNHAPAPPPPPERRGPTEFTLEPDLADALRAGAAEIDPADLDMRRWIDAEPL